MICNCEALRKSWKRLCTLHKRLCKVYERRYSVTAMEFQHELVIPDEGLPFKFFLFEGSQGNYVREKHWHTSVEIFAVMEGELVFYLNEEKHPLKAGELMIVNSNEVHSIESPEKNQTAVLQIPLKQFKDYFVAPGFVRFEGSLKDTDQKLEKLICEMYQLYIKKETGYEFRLRAFYYEILYLLVSKYRIVEVSEQEIRYSRRLDVLTEITRYMREHYKEELKLTDVAAIFGYSTAYLSRMFKKYADINFKVYLQDIRMTYAYRELLNTDKTISQIAIDNGFSSNRAFTREFQKRYGILPSVLERQKSKKCCK